MVEDLRDATVITEAQSQQLITFGYLRNALSHWEPNERGQAIADPRPDTLADFDELARRVMEPTLAVQAIGGQEVLTLNLEHRMSDFLEIVRHHNFSQVPVISSGKFKGVLTVGAVAKWLAEKTWSNPEDFRGAHLSSVHLGDLDDPAFLVRSPTLTAPEAISAFNIEVTERAIAGIVLLDESGSSDRVVAMIVPWDIPALLRAT